MNRIVQIDVINIQYIIGIHNKTTNIYTFYLNLNSNIKITN